MVMEKAICFKTETTFNYLYFASSCLDLLTASHSSLVANKFSYHRKIFTFAYLSDFIRSINKILFEPKFKAHEFIADI